MNVFIRANNLSGLLNKFFWCISRNSDCKSDVLIMDFQNLFPKFFMEGLIAGEGFDNFLFLIIEELNEDFNRSVRIFSYDYSDYRVRIFCSNCKSFLIGVTNCLCTGIWVGIRADNIHKRCIEIWVLDQLKFLERVP